MLQKVTNLSNTLNFKSPRICVLFTSNALNGGFLSKPREVPSSFGVGKGCSLSSNTWRKQGVIRCSATDSSVNSIRKASVIFLGTPEVAASSLETIIEASRQQDSGFEVTAVVSQPGKPRGRGKKKVAMPTPVAEMAAKCGFPPEKILTPFKAREEDFLEEMAKLAPDLCITAAYGNMLPTAFLNIPRYGTLNIHPSLLPKFRGAAPVQRAVEAGVEETGVSVAYTVLACDAGPVLAQRRVAPGDDIQAPELLEQLFTQGTELLLERIDSVMDEAAIGSATPQDETAVVHAAKVAKEEGVLDFKLPAKTLHNKVHSLSPSHILCHLS
ncbi:hypothetical protein CYMTET_22573 [Cymbomonas tetramitiformis]|uniref:methionyl-tRNA formyltransferase n=1 Tax=Cymbomonas tetramitiformis TaxID=36881 RepID=A0AAE0G113_9CHLO|nr:hypothetical protein CYMTET_22573 [Cymbomonas tetramitiformis]